MPENDAISRDAMSSSDEAAQSSSPFAKRGVRIVLLGILLALIVGALTWYLDYRSRGRFMQSTDNAYVQADSVIVAPKIPGYVDQVFVSENQSVRAGQPLVKLDPRDYGAETSQAAAQIDVSQATAEGVRAQIREQQAAIARAAAQVARAEAEAKFLGDQVGRYEPLAATGAEPRERLIQLRSQYAQARADLAARRSDLVASRQRVGTLKSQVDQALAQVRATQARLEATNVNLQATQLKASISGRVGDLTVRVGQFVQAGTRMMTIVPTEQIYVEANFKETQVGLMRVGQPVQIEVDALPGMKLRGRVASMAPGTGAQFSILPPQNATGNFTKIVQRIPVRIAIDASASARNLLIPGMSVEVTVDTRSGRERLDKVRADQERQTRKQP